MIVLSSMIHVKISQANQRQTPIERTIFTNVIRMMYGKREGDVLYVREHGLILRPRTIKSAAYQAEYDQLVEYMIKLTEG